MRDEIIINKKALIGEDGYRTFSLRIKEETVNRLENLSQETNRSRNELITIFIEYGLDHFIIK